MANRCRKSLSERMDSLIALGVLGLLLGGIFCIAFPPPPEEMPESQQLGDIDDIPLLTDEQKKVARATGVADYDVAGVHYVDASLPREYYDYRRKHG